MTTLTLLISESFKEGKGEFESRARIENYDDERLFHDKSVDPLRRIQGTLQEVSKPIYNENITLVLPDRSLNVDRIGRIVFW